MSSSCTERVRVFLYITYASSTYRYAVVPSDNPRGEYPSFISATWHCVVPRCRVEHKSSFLVLDHHHVCCRSCPVVMSLQYAPVTKGKSISER